MMPASVRDLNEMKYGTNKKKEKESEKRRACCLWILMREREREDGESKLCISHEITNNNTLWLCQNNNTQRSK